MEYDERWEHGDLVSSKQAYLCLAVDAEDGQVCVGASTKEGTIVSGIDVRLVGAEPDALTRSDVLYHVAALGESISLARDPEGMARDDAAMKANANTEDRLVALYAAEAKRMLTQP
jgi:hypothetical protein